MPDRLLMVAGYASIALSLLYVGRKFAEFAASYALLSHQIAQALAVLAVMTAKEEKPPLKIIPRSPNFLEL